jgi:flagellar protein FlgJ
MDVNAWGTAYLDDYRLTGSGTGLLKTVNQNENQVNNGQNFAALLKQAGSGGGDTASPAKQAVIDKTDKLYEQCLELETFLVKTLISGMRNTIQKSGLIDEGFAGKMYEDMLYDEYARDFTRNANFGLAEQAYLELSGQRGRAIVNHSAP